MMELLAEITKFVIDKNYISYDELYYYDEEELFSLIKDKNDEQLRRLIFKFENIKKSDIPTLELPKIKMRKLNPIVNGKRIKNSTIE